MRLDKTLVRVKERSFLDIMDLALVVVTARPLTIGLTAAVGIAPWAALNAWLAPEGSGTAFGRLLLIVAEAPLATAPLTVLLGGLMFGDRPTAWQVLRRLLGQAPALILFQVLLRGVLLATFALAWLPPLRLPFLNEVILLERNPLSKVYSRCSDLTSDRAGELLAQWVAMIGFGGAFGLACWVALSNLRDLLAGEPILELADAEGLSGWTEVAGIWIAAAFFAVVRFLTYIDQRIRLEGWEVELRLRAAGATLRRELEP